MVMHLPLPIVIEGKRQLDELVEVEQVEGTKYRIVCPPAMVEGLASGDLIELDDKELAGFKVVHRSGLVTVWLFFVDTNQRNENMANPLFEQLLAPLGGRIEGLAKQSAIFSIPVASGFTKIEQAFDRLTSTLPGSGWMYGNVWGGNDEPLNWWSPR
jgi:hypothetical protein